MNTYIGYGKCPYILTVDKKKILFSETRVDLIAFTGTLKSLNESFSIVASFVYNSCLNRQKLVFVLSEVTANTS